MSENIKTEFEIITSYMDRWGNLIDAGELPPEIEKAVDEKANKKWVSLSWLEKQILNEAEIHRPPQWHDCCRWMLSLLETEK
jgi:hypothetical protein